MYSDGIPIHIDTIMGLPIVYFKGSQVEFSKLRCILNETSKPPVHKAHFFNITHLLLNCFATVYLYTCLRRLNITQFDSIRMFIYA